MKLPRGGRVPPTDGTSHWRYPVTEKVMLRAGGRDELIDLIFQFRLRSNIPPGNIERDIDKYYCDRYPSFCHSEPSDTNPALAPVLTEPLLNRVSRWVSGAIHKMPRGGYALVLTAEAEARAVICSACPKNGGWRGGCGGCSATTLQLLQQVKQLRKTTRDGNLSACQIGGWENGASVHLPVDAMPITEEQRAEMPAACWRKAIL